MANPPKKFFKKQSPERKGKAKKIKITKPEKVATKKGKQQIEPKDLPKKPQFPKISRLIPELPQIHLGKPHMPSFKTYAKGLINYSQTKLLLAGVLLLFSLLLMGFVAVSSYTVYASWSKQMTKRQQLYAEMQQWDTVTKTYPTYRDAYFKGALLAYELDDSQKLHFFLAKLQLLDPNFPLTAALEKLNTVQQLGDK